MLEHDPVVVTNRVSDVEEALTSLKDLGRLGLDTYLDDPHKIASSKYHLIVAIEASLDLANHLIAKNRFRVPQDNADSFRVLEENDVLTAELASDLADMARFRNLLVHRYAEVDDRRVHAIIGEDITDLHRFVEAIGKVIGA